MSDRLLPTLRLVLFLLLAGAVAAQPSTTRRPLQIIITPTAADWTYDLGERADFRVEVLHNGQPVPNATVHYQVGPEQLAPEREGTLTLPKGHGEIKGVTMRRGGFVRCHVRTEWKGRTYRNWATAGFAPGTIRPTVENPADFDAFWSAAKAELAEIPVGAKLTLLPEQSTGDYNTYHLRLNNWHRANRSVKQSHFYGILTVPKAPGRYPALLTVPGAGVRPYGPDQRASGALITLAVGIHGIPVTMEPHVYRDLSDGALMSYNRLGMENRDDYYYKRVYLGCVRAVDFLTSMDQYDGEHLAVTGGSQGGALSIVTAALDDRVRYLAAFYPALSDMTGYLEGRAGGWPHVFKEWDREQNPGWLRTAPYYDVVNFARRLQRPGWYSWGFNDNVCPPTSMYAAYNAVTAPKQLHLFEETAHWTYPEQQQDATKWLLEQLGAE
ncbi:MAG: acetylxylan esterase [Catalinimonas sp.]